MLQRHHAARSRRCAEEEILELAGVIASHPSAAPHNDRGQGYAQAQELCERFMIPCNIAKYVGHPSFGKKLFHHTARSSVLVAVEIHRHIFVCIHLASARAQQPFNP